MMQYVTPATEAKKYSIVSVEKADVKWFAGYDFMGSVIWASKEEALMMDPDEADQILRDLEAAE